MVQMPIVDGIGIMACNKKCYFDKETAQAALEAIPSDRSPREVRYYKCPECHCYHLTSIPASHPNSRRTSRRRGRRKR